MSPLRESKRRLARFGLSIFATALIVLTGTGFAQDAKPTISEDVQTSSWRKPHNPDSVEPYWGEHQGGIVTAPQHHLYFASFDIVTSSRDDVVKLLQAWTAAAARMSEGETAQPLESGLKLAVTPAAPKGDEDERPDPSTMAADTGEATGMSPSRLTITVGFGASLFVKDGKDRFGLAAQRPESLVDMPTFNGDQMAEGRTGGDLAIQVCAEDPQVAFHAVRQLARIAEGVARIRWVQIGYRPSRGERHLLGFSNGKGNPNVDDVQAMDESVWVGAEGPEWMRGGSYAVVRRIRFAVEHWDQMPVAFQEKAIGETKHAGMQTSKPEIPAIKNEDADTDITHLRIVGPGAKTILRRSYSYNDGVNFTTERWPPWRQGLEYDAGMFFICYQRDPRSGFIPMFSKMAKNDFLLNQFWTHEGGGLFAYPRGPQKGEYVGQRLFESR
jgi:deferrochelatase/peroxidase EfeB